MAAFVLAGLVFGADASAQRYAYVSNEGSGDVSVVDLQSKSVVASIAVDGRPRGIRLSPDRRTLFVAVSDSLPNVQGGKDAIVAIDVATRRITGRIEAGTDPEQFDITPDGRYLVSANEDAGTASITDLRTKQVVATLIVGIEPEGVAISPDGRFAYVTAETSNTVSVIDIPKREVVANMMVGVRPRGVTFSPDGTRAFVSAEIGGSVAIVDAKLHRILREVALENNSGKPVGVSVSPDNRRVYIANGAANAISVVNTDDGRVVGRLPVERRPWGVAVSADGRTIVTANGGSNSISVVDVSTGSGFAVKVGLRPWGVAL